ncbi:polysaccharide deacetylase family protein [Halalkalicoccus sp. NIPERK01]|uniref:polysaccharide deacetylase family protein n=1 Tax=Halalkalicoccus sp. NIPERK01 TaxID=3053469 RepID=UPI00256F0476|nr:polysaccharide deacetylase family protein [Halalkalicoccus sp. NIPERK01]
MSTDPSISRRRILRCGVLAGALSLAGCFADERAGVTSDDDPPEESAGGSGEERRDDGEKHRSPELPEGGAVVFVYDDGPLEDYTQAFPAHQAFDAPATVGVVSDWLGRPDYQTNGCMDVAHLEELVEAGWEVASHTTEHTTLGTFELLEDAYPGDERIYPEEIRHGYHRGKTLEIADDEHTLHRTVADYGSDGIGRYIELAEPVGEACAAGETRVRYPAEQMRASLRDSKRALERAGFAVDTLLAPYDNFDDYSREFVAEYYSGVANARHGSRVNDPEGFDPFYTRRDYFIEFTSPERVKADLDEIAERGALGVIGAHTFKEEVTEERIHETLSWVHERGISVLTLRDAIERCA